MPVSMSCARPEPGRLLAAIAILVPGLAIAAGDPGAPDRLANCYRTLSQPGADRSMDAVEVCTREEQETLSSLLPAVVNIDEVTRRTPEFAAALSKHVAEATQAPLTPALLDGGFVRLDQILTEMELEVSDSGQAGLLTRFFRWLGEKLGGDDSDNSALLEWLENFELSERSATILRWSLLGLLVIAAALVVLNELRVAGVWAGRRRSRFNTAGNTASAPPADTQIRTAAGLQGLSPLQQAVAYFSLAVATLRERRQLPVDDSLTNLELAHRLGNHPARPHFDRLRRAADLALYAHLPPTERELGELQTAWRGITGPAVS